MTLPDVYCRYNRARGFDVSNSVTDEGPFHKNKKNMCSLYLFHVL